MTEKVENQEAINPLEMSDEDFLNAAPPSFEAPVVEKEPEQKDEPKAPVDQTDASDEGDEGEGEGATNEDAPKASESAATEATDKEGEQDPPKDAAAKEEQEPTQAKTEEKPKVETEVDYKAAYERLTAPFKANGREIKVDSVEDAISLMQMGANYNKKMAALKPNLKLMKLLENNGFLNEEKIGFLMDLGKKNPAAISKLIKDSGLDPMDLDAEKASAYKQSSYTVDDREIELDTVLDELKGSPSYNRTLDIVSNKWDASSKDVLVDNPQLLKVINDHVDRGYYDLIEKEVERERMFGRLNGLSYLQAYQKVGDAIQARGGFNHLGSSQGNSEEKPVIVTPKEKPVDDDKLKDKRRAASSTKAVVPTPEAKADYNPLAMSDEEFTKMVNKKFL